jgi:hypothetical protein
MPTHKGIDSKGTYYQWGNQKKYYYSSKKTEQGEAIKISENKK